MMRRGAAAVYIATKKLRRLVRENGRRATALLLTVVLTMEALFNSGVTVALAEALNDGGSTDTVVEQQVETGDVTGSEGDATLNADATPGGPTDDNGETAVTTGGATGSTDGITDTTTTVVTDATGGTTDVTGTPGSTENNGGDPQEGEAAKGTEGEGGDVVTDTPDPRAVDAWDWTGRTNSLQLSSPDGLALDVDSLAATLDGSQQGGDGESPDPAAVRDLLPSTLPATLDLTFSLDPAADAEGVGDHAVIVAGDTFTVSLPAGITVSDEMLSASGDFEIYQADDEGNPTGVLIARGTLENDGAAVKVTFVDPVDAGTGAEYYVGSPVEGTIPATQTEGRTQLSVARASVALSVDVSSDLVADDASEIDWVLQAGADGHAQQAALSLPALPDLAELLGIEPEGEKGEDGEESTDTAEEAGPSAQENALLSARAATETTYSLGNLSGSDQMTITWCDNNSASRPTPDSYGDAILPMFRVGGGKWIVLLTPDGQLTNTAKVALHITGDTIPNWAKQTSVTRASVSDWNASISGMPTKLTATTQTPTGEFDDHGNPTYSTSTIEQDIEWMLQDTNKLPEGYIYGENDEGKEGEHRYLMSTTEVSFTVIGKIGNQTLPNTFQAAQAEDFVFSASIDNEETGRSDTIANLVADGTLKLQTSEDGNTCTITATLPMYDEQGRPIVYYIEYKGDSEGTDYYQATYNNAASPSHGSATDKAYDGGTMTLRHMGTTTFDATKAWLDDDNQENRPATRFTLWRYANNGTAGATTASQVQLTNKESGTLEYASISLDAKSETTVDLGDLLASTYQDVGSLPKYDPDGYPYIYALREESAPAGYEIVYGSVDGSGNVTDTAPNYQDPNGDPVTLTGKARPSTDPLIYNGGTVTNRLTGTVEVTSTKTWEIAAFQDDLTDVVVTFTAQSRVEGSDDAWQNVTGENATHEETGWKSETLTRSFSDTFPQYNSLGQELEYRWVESNVTLGDQQTNFTFDSDKGAGSFTLTLPSPDGEGSETLDFTSTYTPADPDDETSTDMIVNTFSNVTDQHVDKYWEQPDGTLAQIKPVGESYPDYLDMSGNVTFDVFQDGVLVGTFTLDGSRDKDGAKQLTLENGQVAEGMSGVTYQETSSYHADILNLPKYAPDGSRHSYLVLEQNPSGWHTERTYDDETRTTTVENTYGPGEGSEIRVMKDWVDGDDAAHRQQVVVELRARHAMESTTKGPDGVTPLYSYDANEVVDVFGKGGSSAGVVDQDADTITLSAATSWYAEVDVPIGNLSYQDFYLVEVALTDGTDTNPVVASTAEAIEKYGENTVWANVGWDYESTQDTERVATDQHVYEVNAGDADNPSYNRDMKAVSVSNRRIGILDLTVTKTWEDGGDVNARPEAELVLSCVEYPNDAHENYGFSIDAEGRAWVQVSHNRLPVLDADGNQLTDEDVRLDGDDLVVKVDTEQDKYSFGFFGLPKYDADGNVVHYDVNERWVDEDDHGEYTSSKTVGTYHTGALHFHDDQTISFENTRQGVRDVTFYKHWNDQYVNEELSQRPDIYLTLYRLTVSINEDGDYVYGDLEPVDGYQKYEWTGTADPDGDIRYDQVCTVSNLPKYNEDGLEYIYYASESMAADGEALDYAHVQFDYDSIQDAHKGVDYGIKVDKDAPDANPETDGSAYAMHEGGTFVNMLTSTLVANGTKLWSNVPGNVVQSASGNDLPEITIYLQRRVAGETSWPELSFTVNDDGTWAFAEGGDGAVAWTSELTYVTNNQYSYKLTHEEANGADPENEDGKPLDRYTSDGKIYECRAIEVAWGLMDQPGGFTANEIEGVNVADPDGEQTSVKGVYVIEHGETGSFRINNVYQSDKGNLTVKKHFTGRAEGDLYPATTFDVYRFYETADGTSSDAELVDSKTFSSEELAGLTNNSANGTFTHTFEDLDIYAPDGSCWQYYVVERAINGYTTTVGVGDLDVNSGQLTVGETANGGMRSETLGTSEHSKVVADDEAVDVTFQNEYEPESANLTGTKTWNDRGNIFGIRPTEEQFRENLKVERIGNGVTEDITDQLQSDDPNGAYYYTIEQQGNQYEITINNVEKWAPNGASYQYRVTEDLSTLPLADGETMADAYYQVTVGPSSTVTASSSTSQFRLTNALEGEATVSKTWVDGEDPYGLRPSDVTVRLQARAGDSGEWSDAYDLLKTLASEEQLNSNELGSSTFTKTLSENNGWKSSWTNLPYAAMQDGQIVTIQYRVVETAIGEQQVMPPTADASAQGEGTIYDEYHPYQPSQTTTLGDKNSATTITNTLETTKISATKTWAGDDGDAWGTRPGSGNTWSVTYLLQQKLTTDAEWHWLMEYGADQATTPLDENIVSQTITGTSDTNTVTWENLPKCDESSALYEYRVVEQVPGSYDVTGGTEVATATDSGVTYRYYVVASTEDASGYDTQSFTNDLRTVGLTGTKLWEDFDTTLADNLAADNMPTMVLYRQAEGGTAEQVKMKDGSALDQPEWTETDDGLTFTYTDLPAADKNNKPYTYWAEEQPGSVPGFYPVYGTADAAGTDADKDPQQGTTITNYATRLELDKISDFNNERLANIELSVQSRDGNTTYGVWYRDAEGNITTWTLVEGGTKAEVMTDDNKMTGDAAGYVVGLPAGNYKVAETGDVPAGYAKAQDVNFTINNDGSATRADGVVTTVAVQTGIKTITVTAEDPVLRGHLQLTKKVSDSGTYDAADATALQGAKFSLYRVDMDGDDTDELIASGLTTNASGVITTRSNVTAIEKKSSAGEDLTYGGKYNYLRDGLPEGTYYFVETDATPGAVMPSGDDAKTDTMTITQDNHYDYTKAPVATTMGNEDFSAEVVLKKYDTVTGDGIENAQFSLLYTPEGSTPSTRSTVKTDSTGTLTLSDLEKGSYTLTETSNTGYETPTFSATFTIENEDDDRTFTITNVTDGADIDFTVTRGTFADGEGIPNTPLRGSVTMLKRGANNAALNGTTFELQRNDNGTWNTIAKGLVTGNTYKMNADNDALDGAGAAGAAGRITVSNLLWGEYRFVETTPAPGYVGETNGQQVTSSAVTIDRNHGLAAAVSAGVLYNTTTSLEINKVSDGGQALEGAKFEVTPIDGSTFADETTDAKTITTNGSGLAALNGQLVVGGTYTIYESKAPVGYDPVDGLLTVTVKTDGSLEVKGDLPDGWSRTTLPGQTQPENQFSFTALNKHLAIELVKVSAEDDATRLEGAEFTLSGPCMDGDSTHVYTTGEDGVIEIDAGLLAGVKYTLTETQTPAGYLTMDPIYFEIEMRGSITVVDLKGETELTEDAWPAGWTVNDDQISFMAADEPVRLSIEKVDAEDRDTKLSGAEFSVTPAAGSTFADGSTDAKTLTTGADGTDELVAQLVVGNSYVIEETKAPSGYVTIDGSMTVTVRDDGSIRIADGTTAPTEFVVTEDNTVQVFTGTVTNDPTKLTVNKVDATTNRALSGATFTLTGTFADGSTEQTLSVTDEATGSVELDKALLIADGQTEYTLRETVPPAGFERIQEDFTFIVATDGAITPTGTPDGWTLGNDEISVTAADKPVTIDLVKLGEDTEGQELTGAEFLVRPADGSTFANAAEGENESGITVTTDDASALLEGRLVVGDTYTLEETHAPDGYELISGTLTFTVNDDGTFKKVSGDDAWEVSATDDGFAVITATDTPIEVLLAKRGSNTGETLIGDVTFDLYRVDAEDGEETLTFVKGVVTSADGPIAIDGLVGGRTYVLREVAAPDGYELLGDLRLTVGTDGVVTLDETEGFGLTSDEGVETITATDQAIEVRLEKSSQDGSEPLPGAVFMIEPADETTSFAGEYAGSASIELPATGEDGAVEVPAGALVAGGAYQLTEVTAPAGYELAGSVTFTVDEDGVLSIGNVGDAAVPGTEGSGTYAVAEDGTFAVVRATDVPVEITVSKVDGTGARLAGAELTLTEQDPDGSEPQVLAATTGEDGTATFSGLRAGSAYRLAETVAPAGYELLTEALLITVAPDGTISLADGSEQPSAFVLGSDGVSVAVINQMLGVTLVKQDLRGHGLAGAEFTLSGPFADGSEERTFVSDELGLVFGELQLTGSPEGTAYTLTETRAPEGYETLEPVTLLVFEDGTVELAPNASDAVREQVSVDNAGTTAIVTLRDVPLPTPEEVAETGDSTSPLLPVALGAAGVVLVGVALFARRRRRG